MSRLEELIQELCPNGVEYKALSDITIRFTDGMHSLPRDIRTTGQYPILSAQNVNNGKIDLYTTKYVMSDIFQKENKRTDVCKGDVLLTIVGAIGRVAVVKDNLQALFQRSVCVIKPNKNAIIPEYLGYALEATSIQSYMQINAHGAAQKGLYLEQVGKLRLPVPPLEVQHEIVRILDNFTELTAELTAELIARKKQYEYYREKLLTYNINIYKKTLDELCYISAGGDVPKESMSKEKTERYCVPIISNGIGNNALYGYTDVPKITKAAVTIAARGTIGYAEFRDYPYFPIIRLLSVIPKDKTLLNTKYLYYCLQGKQYNVPTSGIPQLTAPMLKKEKIPIPSLEVQERIVNVLDNFDAICKDLNIGLPAEIEARQKQYEYYRDLLLTLVEGGNIILNGTERNGTERSN